MPVMPMEPSAAVAIVAPLLAAGSIVRALYALTDDVRALVATEKARARVTMLSPNPPAPWSAYRYRHTIDRKFNRWAQHGHSRTCAWCGKPITAALLWNGVPFHLACWRDRHTQPADPISIAGIYDEEVTTTVVRFAAKSPRPTLRAKHERMARRSAGASGYFYRHLLSRREDRRGGQTCVHCASSFGYWPFRGPSE